MHIITLLRTVQQETFVLQAFSNFYSYLRNVTISEEQCGVCSYQQSCGRQCHRRLYFFLFISITTVRGGGMRVDWHDRGGLIVNDVFDQEYFMPSTIFIKTLLHASKHNVSTYVFSSPPKNWAVKQDLIAQIWESNWWWRCLRRAV